MCFAHACSLIYLTLYNLNEVHFLYNYSLEFLLEIFTTVLELPQLKSVKIDSDARLAIIMKNLFKVFLFIFCIMNFFYKNVDCFFNVGYV